MVRHTFTCVKEFAYTNRDIITDYSTQVFTRSLSPDNVKDKETVKLQHIMVKDKYTVYGLYIISSAHFIG